MLSPSIDLDAHTEVYHDLKRMLHQIVSKFCSRHGENFDEMLAIANLAFCECLPQYEKQKARFTTHVYLRVYYSLLETFRRNKRRAEVFCFADVEADSLAVNRHETFMTDLFDELNDDARTVVKLVLKGRDVSHSMQECNTIKSTKTAVRNVLNEIGWTASRITESFNEIAHALAK